MAEGRSRRRKTGGLNPIARAADQVPEPFRSSAMFELMFGSLVVAGGVVVFLIYFELIDLADVFELIFSILKLIVGALKVTAGLLFAVGAFFVYRMTRRGQDQKPG
jgi:hypothetical protein